MSTLKVNELDTKSGTTITVAAGKTLAGTDIIDTAQIAANAVDTSEIAAGAVTNVKTDFQPGTTFKGDGSSADGKITLNCSQNTHGVSIQSPTHASAASYTLTLPTTDGNADEFMQTDGSGVLTWAAAGGTNTPAWHVGINSSTQAISDATATKVELDDVKFDTGFTWDTTNYKGIPGTAGKYLIGCFADLDYAAWGWGWVYLYKNGVSQAFWGFQDNTPEDSEETLTSVGGSTIIDLGTTDYVEMFVYIDYYSGTGTIRQYDATQCVTYMYGMKLIGA